MLCALAENMPSQMLPEKISCFSCRNFQMLTVFLVCAIHSGHYVFSSGAPDNKIEQLL